MDQAEILATMRPWLMRMAWRYTNDSHTANDLAQEGWIAAWRALHKHSPLSFARKAATWRMVTCISDSRWLENSSPVPEETGTGDSLTAVEFDVSAAYHEGEAAQAIDDLTPQQKELVRLRFWQGFNFHELGEQPQVWGQARDTLSARLRHLKDVT